MSVKEDGGTVGVFSPKGVSQVIFICIVLFTIHVLKANLQEVKVQSHLLVFTIFYLIKSSHFNRNSCNREFCVRMKGFHREISHQI